MRKTILLLFAIVSISLFTACEKDDICIAGDTPKMRISFLDITDQSKEKAPERLLIVGKDKTTPISTLSAGSSSITGGLIPLAPNANQSEFNFVSNASITSEGVVSGNIDVLIITYNTTPIFISKACGYIVNYENLIALLTPDSDNWIKKIEVITPTISNEEELHIKIYH